VVLQANIGWTIEHASPVGPQVYRILRERIIHADLVPGSRISEAEIARTFALSRQPVREAFIKLSEEGLVEVRPQRGTLVRRISQEAVMDARFVREAIEADIVKLLAAGCARGVVAELRSLIAQQKAVHETEPDRFLKLDELFHRTMADAAGKSYAWDVIEAVKAQMDRVRYLSFLHFPMPKLVDQHNAVVDAIDSGDVAAADLAIRDHLREILTGLPAIALAHPEFFETAG